MPDADKQLLKEFDAAMLNIYHEAFRQCRYRASDYYNMLHELRGLGTAKRLLSKSGTQYGFTKLHECGCLHITVECLVLRPKYQKLFGQSEPDTARKRLRDHGFDPAKCEAAT